MAGYIEHVATLADRPAMPRSLRAVGASADLAWARTCYDHLAGALGAQLIDAMIVAGVLSDADGQSVTAVAGAVPEPRKRTIRGDQATWAKTKGTTGSLSPPIRRAVSE